MLVKTHFHSLIELLQKAHPSFYSYMY